MVTVLMNTQCVVIDENDSTEEIIKSAYVGE